MSGAAAIAAAKNRRGRSDMPSQNQVISQQRPPQTCSRGPTPQQQTRQPQPQSRQLPQQPNSNEQQRPMNPLQILSNHESRLNTFDKSIIELQNSINQLATLVTTKKDPVVVAPSQENLLSNESGSMMERVSLLEEMFHHLKEDIFRVQTFAMETNLAFLKYQASENNNLTEVNNSVAFTDQSLVSDNVSTTEVVVEMNTADVTATIAGTVAGTDAGADNATSDTLSTTEIIATENNILLQINEPAEWTTNYMMPIA